MKLLCLGLGCAAFLMFVLYDWFQLTGTCRLQQFLFPTGLILLTGVSVRLLFLPPSFMLPVAVRFFAGGGLVIFLILLIYSLFFAIPFKETYLEEHRDRRVFDRGVYALCRHPVVLWLFGLYGCLWLVSGVPEMGVAWLLFSFLDILYVSIQDRWIFPRIFCDYTDYRRRVPFLIPNRTSAGRCIRTFQRKGER